MTKQRISVDRASASGPPSAGVASRASSLGRPPAMDWGGADADRMPRVRLHPASDTRLLLRPLEVAAVLGLSRSKVFELLAAQELPSVHIGRSTRVPRSQLEEWIQTQVCWQPQAPSGLLGRLRRAAAPRA